MIRRYAERRSYISDETIVALPTRPDLFIEFYLGEPLRIRDDDRRPGALDTDTIVVAPHARRLVKIHLAGLIHYFSIQLQPAALHRLFGIPTDRIADSNVRAADLFGCRLHSLRDAVLGAPDFDARVVAAERWFGDRLREVRADDPVDLAARLIRRTAGVISLPRLVERTGLSERQWRRRFVEQAGVAPKLYARIARLDGAIERRRRHPAMSWTEIAFASGYADQSHMLLDARALLGTTPAAWLGHPELGSHTLPDLLAGHSDPANQAQRRVSVSFYRWPHLPHDNAPHRQQEICPC